MIPGFGGSVAVPLDEADAVVTISRSIGDDEATVSAAITDSNGRDVELGEGQAVLVNGQALTGPDGNGNYGRTIPAANEYTVTVNEPSRGQEETVIPPPADFEVTSPQEDETVSLAGFTVEWSNADAGLDVEITLRETIFGNEQVQRFGPFTDTGSQSFDVNDLSGFQQGAQLIIEIAKINERRGINGFNSATLQAKLVQTRSATPGP